MDASRYLRKLIREVCAQVLREGESFRVTYTAKDGRRESKVFPKKQIADMYAKTVKNAVVEPADLDVADVSVQRVPPADFDAQRQSSKAFYRQSMAGEKFEPRPAPPPPPEDDPPEYKDAYRAAIMAGASPEEAWREVDYVRYNVPGRQRR